ncbi:MAG TPA: C39 family peptidase, partial [Chloroflexota bacterium]|nr:C39 family peptidase [Chloroflexota bacterium]
AEVRGFAVEGLYDYGDYYRQWTLDDLATEVNEGHPVLLLVRYWSLPCHGDEEWWGDHYIVFLGFTPDGDVVYHDPAFGSEYSGSYMVMSQERLMRAWSRTQSGIQYSGMAVVW